ncbi:cytochrome c oxidase subunit II [Haloarcula nitratireducens]|uniref:cytochrome-c oxidase n=1 Tax=Haloarcula nitratireducens TaxID=2487749 RepID=A0AAW4PFH1_9EURY|nr:cytochrome c oxidase subunit II [Halomicroarcula nitratireducens]MBX0296730.1 cytochrome c oxidase subunit II [Halomicroarcula nitratireducens]
MRREALPIAVLVSGIALVALTDPAAAAPGHDSNMEALIQSLTNRLVFVALTVGLLVEGALVYGTIKYRNSGEASPNTENPRFHLSYVVAVTVILLFVGLASFQTFGAMGTVSTGAADTPDEAVTVHVIGQQWLWKFQYPEEKVVTVDKMAVPVDTPVRLIFTSEDVVHSFHAPEIGLKQDAFPSQRNELLFTPTDQGTYDVYCAQFCGREHSEMLATLHVLNATEYETWINEHSVGEEPATTDIGTPTENNSTARNASTATTAAERQYSTSTPIPAHG